MNPGIDEEEQFRVIGITTKFVFYELVNLV